MASRYSCIMPRFILSQDAMFYLEPETHREFETSWRRNRVPPVGPKAGVSELSLAISRVERIRGILSPIPYTLTTHKLYSEFENSNTKMTVPCDVESYLLDKANIQDTMVRMVSYSRASFNSSFISQLLELSTLIPHRCTASTQKRPRQSSIWFTRRRPTSTTICS